jgi:purine-nucleoside/S-methyl-5'-thioadenosine phosphorylase / adenosine deaminase
VERRVFPGDIRALVSEELERRGFLAAFTERIGGASEDPYSSLNLGSEVGDAPEAVLENRRRLGAALGVGELASARQVHGTAVLEVTGREAAPAEADALVTTRRSLPLAVMTADCVPVALASEAEGMVAAVHVGWRGLVAGIVQRALRLFGKPREVVAAIGPAIGPCHYEVGPEVVEAVRRAAGDSTVASPASGRPHLDLEATVEGVLRAGDVQAVERSGACTACEPARFFSHRRDGITGRQAMVAVRL